MVELDVFIRGDNRNARSAGRDKSLTIIDESEQELLEKTWAQVFHHMMVQLLLRIVAK